MRTWALADKLMGLVLMRMHTEQDVLSLIVQGVGGGLASSAAESGGDARLVGVTLCIPFTQKASRDISSYREVTSCWAVSSFNWVILVLPPLGLDAHECPCV